MKKGLLLKIGILVLTTVSVFADQSSLKTSDIQEVMQQIFSQHYDQKKMTASILRKSFRIYIDQFDPDRIYLLEREVKPYLEISDQQLNEWMEQYQAGKFPEYQKLNDLIQKAILRARGYRKILEDSNLVPLFLDTEQPERQSDEWTDPDLKRSFAKEESDLPPRWKEELEEFIFVEKQRYGSPYVAARQKQTVQLFERRSRDHEDQYLYTNEEGIPMGTSEKQNAFTLHILKALASSLDAHTTVLNPAEAYDMKVRLEKKLEGVGMNVQLTPKGYRIAEVISGSPAAKSGVIQVNDQLVTIDGISTSGLSFEKVMEMLQGKKGTAVSLVLKRPSSGNQEIRVTLTRESVQVDQDRVLVRSVPYEGGEIGILKLDSFYQSDQGISSEEDVRAAIEQLDKNKKLKGLILDFRENSGGFLMQAVKVAGLFITNGVIVVSKYFDGKERVYRDVDGKTVFDGPLIVLTSKATASAAEIVAQALQDYGVALVVGDEHTYGKGTIQSQTITDEGASAFFKVTVGKYYTVSGRTPQVQGVKADIVVPSPFAYETMGEEHLEFPLKPDEIASSYNDEFTDVSPDMKSWYLHYYAPSLQKKKSFWQQFLPELKKNSEKRIGSNLAYQEFLRKKARAQQVDVADLQMNEAITIMKEMIRLYRT